MGKKEILLEIGTEEIPARFIFQGLSSLKEGVTRFLADALIDYGEVIEYCTPRRLTLYIKDVSERQKDRTTESIGPPKKVAFDSKGNPTKAAIGFARSQHVDVNELKVIKTSRGEYVAAIIKKRGRMTKNILCEALPKIISSLQFPKTMRWGNGNLRFVRPIHWILVLFGTESLRFELDGIVSGDTSYGHRFIAPEAFRINHPSNYPSLLKKKYVIVSFQDRKDAILQQIEKLESEYGFRVHRDDELLNTVTNLVEYPTVVLGYFDSDYLTLPKELLITVMRYHQKYFSTEDRDGNLLPNFVIVSNAKAENNDIVRRGAERVLRARLEDARFYYNEDRKRSLWDYVEKLKKVTFQEELGSLYEKVERVASISSFIADELDFQAKDDLLRAAMLSKADLVTGVVREFPELQGYMGMIYALNSGEDKEVATAIYEHYLPRFSGDALPSGEMGSILSIADKMDNIASCFFLELIPSGSEDPFALRRQATGIINILLKKDLPITLKTLIEKSLQDLESYTPSIKSLTEKLLRFFHQRFEGILLSEGYSHDIIDATLSIKGATIKEIRERVETLSLMKKSPEFPELLTAAKRVYNILTKTYPKRIREELLVEPAEKELFQVVKKVRPKLEEKDFLALFELKKPINAFFDTVLVMDRRVEVKDNRLALLQSVKDAFERLGDFSKMVG